MNKIKQMQKLLLKIPKGKVTTYKEMAKKMNVHPRTMGRLLNKNPDSDTYPCYKVIYSNGGLGGYGGNIKEKIRRLKKDGIEIKKGKINKKFFYFF
jgi:O-6-methylguanine DNA methyltransferase